MLVSSEGRAGAVCGRHGSHMQSREAFACARVPGPWRPESPGDAVSCAEALLFSGVTRTLHSGSLNNNAVLWFSLVGLRSHPPGAKVQKLKMWGGGRGGRKKRRQVHLPLPLQKRGLFYACHTHSLLTLTVRPGSRGYSVLAYGCGLNWELVPVL